jgi:hypothetical protein
LKLTYSVAEALKVGYRHIDAALVCINVFVCDLMLTIQIYGNQAEVSFSFSAFPPLRI